jgi:hypothetical protein
MKSGMLTLLLAAAAGFGLRLYMNHAGENRLRPGEDIAIGELRGSLPPNAFLACPPGYCRIAAEPGIRDWRRPALPRVRRLRRARTARHDDRR